jgi:glycosyltransferase involved in cell wall biosynthesis
VANEQGQNEMASLMRSVVRRAVPAGSTVLVGTAADDDLSIDDCRTLAFPPARDEAAAGAPPADSAAAIQELDAIRESGAEFLVLPADGYWWSPEYDEFREHLETQYRLVVQREGSCHVYALFESRLRPEPFTGSVPLDEVHALFDRSFYTEQTGLGFADDETALLHYLMRGAQEGYDPHGLFNTAYYLDQSPAARTSGVNPLVHFLDQGAQTGVSPSPYFDMEYYYEQAPGLRRRGINGLVHYVTYGLGGRANDPNPLFDNAYYVSGVRRLNMNPLDHFLRFGAAEGRAASPAHNELIRRINELGRNSLLRGKWKQGTVLFVSRGQARAEFSIVASDVLASEYWLDSVVVFLAEPNLPPDLRNRPNVFVLGGLDGSGALTRPSALRLLVKALAGLGPLLAFTELPEVLETLKEHEVPAYLLATESFAERTTLRDVWRRAERVIFTSNELFFASVQPDGTYPTNVALRSYTPPRTDAGANGTQADAEAQASLESCVRSVLDLARRDFRLDSKIRPPLAADAPKAPPRRIVVPCSDWAISGVNAALHAVGLDLVQRGWELEILFTRDPERVIASAGGETGLPKLPYRFLEQPRPGVEGMWQALIADLERLAPCIAFLSYDFLANSVAPALTDDIGVCAWAQADDGDYYEQAYRLGRYCNSVVCVSENIRSKLDAIHAGIGQRAVVIHNASVSEEDVVESKELSKEKIRIVYTGRLVQYQKRILDFVDLADALDREGVPYTITLIGAFAEHDDAGALFPARAKAHLDKGTIVAPGRLSRDELFAEFANQDFFVLLSDFEGLPLALLEGMARGLIPIAAAMDSGVPEVVQPGENGLIVEGRDYGSWARTIADLWRDRATCERMSAQARATVRDRFSVELAAEQFDALFRRVAEETVSGEYHRPASLHWGATRSPTGDVLPPPSLYRPGRMAAAGIRT